MHIRWLGLRRMAVIPVVVNDPGFEAAPADWGDQIWRRVFYDPDANGVDRSLRTYVHAVSYGKALLAADIFNPVQAVWTHCGATQDAAINASPGVEAYEHAAVVFTPNRYRCDGWAFWHNFPFGFNPARPGTNNLRNWCHVSMGVPLGVWAMEMTHLLTGFGDLYKTDPHPGNFDNMACSCGTHPSTYTKLQLGWLDPASVYTIARPKGATLTLHALALPQPHPLVA